MTLDGVDITINSQSFLKLLNKCKFSISNDETRHYLSGIYLHSTNNEEKIILQQFPQTHIECPYLK